MGARLVDSAYGAGSSDNIAVIVVDVRSLTPPPLPPTPTPPPPPHPTPHPQGSALGIKAGHQLGSLTTSGGARGRGVGGEGGDRSLSNRRDRDGGWGGGGGGEGAAGGVHQSLVFTKLDDAPRIGGAGGGGEGVYTINDLSLLGLLPPGLMRT
jgi:hypothetical protein